ncbi:MAG: tetratricopeptide repeat protein [Muribaculaceae bacterium]
MNKILFIILSVFASFATLAQSLDINNQAQGEDDEKQEVNTPVYVGSEKPSAQKNVRNFIKEGNQLYRSEKFADAEVKYRKALEIDPNNEYAQFNLASSLLKQSGNANPNEGKNPVEDAKTILQNLTTTDQNQSIKEKCYHDLGNLAFDQQQYAESISFYKKALRINPDNDRTRENLRIAQLKLQEQQKNQQNQEQKNQQQEQKDKQQEQKKEEQKQQQQQNKEEQQQNQQQQPSMSDANAEKILKAMENEEAKTRRRVEAQKAREQGSQRRNPEKPW